MGEPFSGNCAKKLLASKTRFVDNQVKKPCCQKTNQAESSVLASSALMPHISMLRHDCGMNGGEEFYRLY
ncbi:MAG: hypothetical protein F6J90_32310 [Moorea sp. SIOASIH]|uniref:hypothetical protein n=1 Tax=Moorena sp. SIOASIH TaxID=2607817 RepID=UPI0013BE17B9|nr:hypothetical protein [Moorena sp. SIOASIH]NEO40768.1 hypothetical protein [Moorena sp. SIOASIH]